MTTPLPVGQELPAGGISVQALATPDVYGATGSAPHGLSSAEVAQRQVTAGANELPHPGRRRLWRRFARQFTDLFAVVLEVAAGITFLAYILGEPRDRGTFQLAVAILGVVVLNAIIGFTQEYSAERTAEALRAMVPHTCRVLRDGVRREIAVRDVVFGDVVLLEAGDAVPADCRLVEARDLAVDNSALTGESRPVPRTAQPVPERTPALEAANRLFMGTSIAAGNGRGVVLAIGAATEFGRIFRLTSAAPYATSPLQRQIATMARWVSLVALVVGASMFVVRLPSGQPTVASFVFALGVMVALVPEGLPATLSVSLAIAVRRMAHRQALVKRLLAVETLGSTTVICTDKTGTLTKAEMTVTRLWAGGQTHAVSGVGYAPTGTVTDPTPVREMLRVAALCCDARLVPPAGPVGWRVLGDTTEGALLAAAAKGGLDLEAAEAATPRVSEFPFDSTRKLMSTVHRVGGGYAAYVKGAPGEVLGRCTHVDWRGERQPLTGALRRAVADAGDAMAADGSRVLAVAERTLDDPRPSRDVAESELTLLGLTAMTDPPRPDVAGAVADCRRAGIRIVMVSGDHPLTAEAIARRVGIVRGGVPTVVTGARLDRMDETALDALLAVSGDLLFCRVNPEHKMRVVNGLQRRGEVVAVTGDGANDAPALKHADIGVAMGASGTDVAREAAVMVLLDDSFASIAAAVRLGRSVYHNIRKFLVYVFSSNVGELVPLLVVTFAGFPLVPLLAVQVLAIDLGSDVLPALALGAEPPEPDVMDQPPRSRRERLMSLAVARRILFLGGIQAAGVTFAFFWHIHNSGVPFDALSEDHPVYREALTITQAGIVLSQFFVALAVRTDRQSVLRVGLLSNPGLLAAGGLGLALMAGISYLPPLQSIFHTAALDAADWALAAAFGLLLLVLEELRKWWLRRRQSRKEARTS
ncbi:cation-transporting P-type ATPase [Phytohabitans houttuyneae]|uniref:ATPase n=1 Tax=Phytohabitans houttuyneae TaxID=1076126 RepID=A0A6V8K6W0_9ACTN|nr:ATPase [Phytohabitans houttuyneae]